MSSAGFTTLLFVCVLMQGFALILGRARGLSRRGRAEEKAVSLKQWLSPAQLSQYETNGYFEVTGNHTGKHYRIRRAQAMNIDQLDEHGARAAAWCFGPEGDLPLADVCWRRRSRLRTMNRPPSPWQTAEPPARGRRGSLEDAPRANRRAQGDAGGAS